MFLGRTGVMAMYIKRRHTKTKDKPKHQYLIDHQIDFKKKMKKRKQEFFQETNKFRQQDLLKYSSTPKAAWCLGLMFIFAAIFLVYILNSGILEADYEIQFNAEIQEDKGQSIQDQYKEAPAPEVTVSPQIKVKVTYWWRYLMILMMGLVGVLFLITVDRETIEIHKIKKLIIKHYRNPWLCCKTKTEIRNLNLLSDISIVKKGHESYSTTTVYYAVEFRYNDENQPLHRLTPNSNPARREEIIQSSNLLEIKKKFVEIMTFLDREFDIGSIKVSQIQDYSTSDKKKNWQKKTKNVVKEESSKLIEKNEYLQNYSLQND